MMVQKPSPTSATQKVTPPIQDKIGTVAKVSLPAAAFALGDALTTLDDLTVKIESTVADGGNGVIPMIRARGLDRESLETVLREDPDVEYVRLLAECEDGWLYRIEWSERIRTRVWTFTKHGATILAATGTNGRWQFRLLCSERSVLSHIYDSCADAGLTLNIEQVYNSEGSHHAQCGLTEKQRNTLAAAFETGYYSIPREIEQAVLADELGISHQALSERLRRATKRLVENEVIDHVN